MIVCAGLNEDFAFARSIGIGLINSTMNLMRICTQEAIKSLVFIGSAGAYTENIAILSLFASDSATQIELSFLQQQSYTPIDNRIDSSVLEHNHIHKLFTNYMVSRETDITKSIVNSSNYITTDMKLSTQYAKADIWLENMEFFAVMKVAQHFKIPCVGIFCVSNYCNTQAHKDFLLHQADVKAIFAQHKTFLQNISFALEKIYGESQ